MRTRTYLIFWTALAISVVLVVALAGCSSEPVPTATIAPTSTPTPTQSPVDEFNETYNGFVWEIFDYCSSPFAPVRENQVVEKWKSGHGPIDLSETDRQFATERMMAMLAEDSSSETPSSFSWNNLSYCADLREELAKLNPPNSEKNRLFNDYLSAVELLAQHVEKAMLLTGDIDVIVFTPPETNLRCEHDWFYPGQTVEVYETDGPSERKIHTFGWPGCAGDEEMLTSNGFDVDGYIQLIDKIAELKNPTMCTGLNVLDDEFDDFRLWSVHLSVDCS